MVAVLNMARQLLDLGRSHLDHYRTTEALRVLRRLIELPDVPPRIAAEASYLIAQIHFNRSEYDEARGSLSEALATDPSSAECHFLLAQSNDLDESGDDEDAVSHYAAAARLAPDDARKQAAYARKLVETKTSKKGLQILEQAYADHGSDPIVVENFVDALIEAGRLEDAELVAAQAAYRNSDDPRFGDIRRRFQQRLREIRLFDRVKLPRPGRHRWKLPFRNFGSSPSSRRRRPTRGGDGSRKRSRGHANSDGSGKEPPASAASRPAPLLHPHMTLAQALKQAGSQVTAGIYETLGLIGKRRPHLQRAEVTAALRQRAFLHSLTRRAPAESRKLLRTVVRAGGYVPAAVLFQNTGPEAPPPDSVQPLLQSGLLFLGRQPGRGSGMVAMVPVDLLERLASVLRIRLDEPL
jgi:tetratricopeptide (TPR) repeat protein